MCIHTLKTRDIHTASHRRRQSITKQRWHARGAAAATTAGIVFASVWGPIWCRRQSAAAAAANQPLTSAVRPGILI